MVRTVTSYTLSLQTDFVESPPINSGGILTGTSSEDSQTVFCWIANDSHINVAIEHLASKNYDKDALMFIPYSSKDNWVARYAFANPSIEVSEDGQLHHLFQHSLTSEQLGKLIASGNSSNAPSEAAAGGNTEATKRHSQLKQRQKKRRAGMELLSNSILTNAERDVLHVEIYKYFTWLKTALEEVEVTHAGKRTLGNACATSTKVQECMDVVKSAFTVVGKNTVEDETVGGSPLLEKVLGDDLSKLVVKAPLREFYTLELLFMCSFLRVPELKHFYFRRRQS